MGNEKPKNRHTSYDLKQMQSVPLDGKILMTKRRIRDWYDYWDGQVYCSFSGGKDSTVLKHIIESMGLDIPFVFVNTGLEYPEIQTFVRNSKKAGSNIEILKPKLNFKEVIEKYGYPFPSKEQAAFIQEYKTTKSEKLKNIRLNGNKWGMGKISKKWRFLIDSPVNVSDKCCDVMKKAPAKSYEKLTGRKPIIGTMASESKQRESNWKMYGCNAFEKTRPTSNPISFWTEQDILEYIVRYNIPYCSVYGNIIKNEETDKLELTGCQRTGCMFCMFGCHLEKEPNRFQAMKKTHPKQYEFCMKPKEDGGLGLHKVLEYLEVPHDWK